MTGGSAAPGAPGADASLRLQFEDNALLQQLFGEHDRHLARIEQSLDVTLSTRGNRLAITGPQDSAAAARTVLMALYERLRRGMTVDGGDVEAALRMAAAPSSEGGAEGEQALIDQLAGGSHAIRTRKRVISPRSRGQARYIDMLRRHELVFALGPAGTGKTYLAVAMAVTMLIEGRVDRIVLSRPAVEAGERLGFLPGDLREKVDPYLQPLYDALYDMMPGEQVARRLDIGEIEIAPLAFMRGRTLANAFVILDEAQNAAPMQMKMFLTRLGEHSRMVVTGDLSQIDLPAGVHSGLSDAISLLDGMEGVGLAYFTDADVVRHTLVARIVRAYDKREKRNAPGDPSPRPRR